MRISFNKDAGAKIKAPGRIIYFVFYILLSPVLKIMFRMKYDRSDFSMPDGPFVVLSNHASVMDFVTVILALYPRRLNAVVAQKYFYYSPLDKFLPFVGCIPKTLFDPDPRSVMGIMSIIKRGHNLLLFPEGRCTTGGGYMGMHKATGKLIKKLGVPVISCHIDGAYNCMPLWRKGVRWGRQRVVVSSLFSADDTQSLTVDEINLRIDKCLSGEFSPPLAKPLHVLRERRLTEGLEGVIYFCPKCKDEFTLKAQDNIIVCLSCGNIAEMDRYARLVSLAPSGDGCIPETVQQWYLEQLDYEGQQLDKAAFDSSAFIDIEADVSMLLCPGKGLELCGRGRVSLSRSGWDFDGVLSGENVRLHFPIDAVPAIPFDPSDNFQIYANGVIYAFTPADNPKACVKCAIVGELAYWRFASHVQMTQGAQA